MNTAILLLLTTASTNITYTNTVKAIFNNRCSRCHDYMPDRNWQVYSIAYKNRQDIKIQMVTKAMPQGDTMPQSERDDIIRWVDEGAKE